MPLICYSYSYKNRLPTIALDFFDSIGLEVKTSKSTAVAARVLSGKKKLYYASKAQSFVKGFSLNTLNTGELLQYLGNEYDHTDESKPHIENLNETLNRMHAAPPKPY